jgi:hypothetical protein
MHGLEFGSYAIERACFEAVRTDMYIYTITYIYETAPCGGHSASALSEDNAKLAFETGISTFLSAYAPLEYPACITLC